ncbi:MAG: amidase family protein [Nibricoccus sp.]
MAKKRSIRPALFCLVSILGCVSPSALRAAEFNLGTATVADINAAFDAGALTSEKLIELCLARIKAYDSAGPRLNAVITLNPRALEIARELDAERKTKGPRSPLHGIPVVLKDLYDTFDMPTTGASKALADNQPPDDAFTVARLRASGAVIFAKVNLNELASGSGYNNSLKGQTKNPYDLTRTPGGSSGGTGAAIAANFAILGTGTDTGQSIRSPASANSCVGIRPSFGLISRDGIIPGSYTQDTTGPIVRYVADLAAMLDAMVGFDPSDTATWAGIGKAPKTYTASLDKNGLKGARIGFLPQLLGDGSHPEHALVAATMEKSIEAMKAAGATVVPIEIPEVARYLVHGNEISVGGFETKWTMDAYFAHNGPNSKFKSLADYIAGGSDSNPRVFASLKRASEATEDALRSPEYLKRLENQARFRDALIAAMDRQNLDALFYPLQRRLVVPAIAEPDQVERNGFLASGTGLPALTVPGAFSPPTADAPKGVPIGVEFLGRSFAEPTLIRLAYAFEQTTHHRVPPASTPALPGETFSY